LTIYDSGTKITTDFLSAHYQMLGRMLNTVIDEIVGEEKNIFEYSNELTGYVDFKKYIFNVRVNKLIVKIDSMEYNLYYNEYNVKIKYNDIEANFNDEIMVYKSIVKIIPSSADNIISSGVSDAFIIAGSLQCKPIEYKIQLTAVLNNSMISDDDVNNLNSQYYFIGGYINELFDEFTKFNDYHEKNNSISLKNKYLKYKNKYLNSKKLIQ